MDPRFKAEFIAAWVASRLLDSATTWFILRNRLGCELNPVPVKLIEYLGLELGLAVHALVGVILGFVLLYAVPKIIINARRMTRFDRVIIATLGRERTVKIILYTALALSFVPPMLNSTWIVASLLSTR
ncbi:hypothetical protein [Stetteria hydrogenophila]